MCIRDRFKTAFRFLVHGIEHVRTFSDGRGCVVAGNHASYLDPVFLWLAARPQQWIRFMARDNMFSNAKGKMCIRDRCDCVNR